MRQIAIRLLGQFAVTSDGEPVTGFAYAKVRALLAYLVVEAPQPIARTALAALLWPEQPERNARGSLSQALLTLRTALGEKDADAPLLLADSHQVWLNPAVAVEVDSSAFSAALAEAEAHAHRSWRTCAACEERLRLAIEHYRGLFLADVAVADSAAFEEWVAVQREHLHQRALSALERLVERAGWRGAAAEALAYAQRLVALDPWQEGSQRTLIGLLALNGEVAAAQAQYRQLHTMLAQELGAAPEPATTGLFDQIRRGDGSGLRPQAPPYVGPWPPTALVGRDADLRSVCAGLRAGDGRALTISGPGGIGKTRLALEAAQAMRFDFEDGVVVVELAAVSAAELVADAIARALAVKERPRQPLRETLQEYLSARHLLLVLDNFEHVIGAAPLVAELLAACPGLRVLVTSRSPLLIRAEQQLQLAPLADADAVELFVRRAEAAGAGLAHDEASTALYTALCRRLDRLPLAIELIAVRARTLTPRELLDQLEQPLQALAYGARDLVERHQSLRHAIQWSYDLLEPEAQRVFRTLGVFAGGCTIEAAQAALGAGPQVLQALEALHRASLVQRHAVAERTRFICLETIREFAREQLARCGEEAEARNRHAEHFARFSLAAGPELLRADASRWRAWVAAEQPNLRAAFAWAMANGLHTVALQLATGCWRFHWMEGTMREGLERIEAALALAGRDQAPLDVTCDALRVAGTLAGGLNDYQRARRWLEAAVEAGWRLGDPAMLQRILTNLGKILLEQGELEDARVHLEVSLSLARRGEHPALAKFPLGILAGLHTRLGEYEQAQALSEEGLRLNQELKDPEGTADAMCTLGTIVNARGDAPRARQLGEGALALHRSLNHQLGMGLDYILLGDVAYAQGDDEEAMARYQACLGLWREQEYTVKSAQVFDRLARGLYRLGDPAGGAALSSAAASLRARAGARQAAGEQAACDATVAGCRAALGAASFDAAWAAGRTLTLAQAFELALQPIARAVA